MIIDEYEHKMIKDNYEGKEVPKDPKDSEEVEENEDV